MRTNTSSRRKFLAAMSAAGLGVAAAALFSQTAPTARGAAPPATESPANQVRKLGRTFPGIPGNTADQIVGNFALTLEILEADLYRQALNAASGLNLHTPLNTDPSAYSVQIPTGGLQGYYATDAFNYLADFAFVEAAHRDFLTAALQALGGPVTSGNAAGYRFPRGPGRNLKEILSNILPLEETGVRAYLGALPYTGTLGFAQTAGTIYSTEARHSAVISNTLGIDPGPNPKPGDQTVVPRYPAPNALEYFLPPATVIQAVKAYYK